VAEIGSQSWRWKADGVCLNVGALGLGQQLMQLPYAIDDNRLEQRAAMQLQLARRYPMATWLANFSVRLTTPLAPTSDPQAVARAGQVVHGELVGLASRWEAAHE
jgi:hypothetical protein